MEKQTMTTATTTPPYFTNDPIRAAERAASDEKIARASHWCPYQEALTNMAYDRIDNTPELVHLVDNCLTDLITWAYPSPDCSDYLVWLITAPIEQILEWSDDLGFWRVGVLHRGAHGEAVTRPQKFR
jgi:hypothetical protein